MPATPTTTEFAPGQRVARRFDGAVGTVESVVPFHDGQAVAVRLDRDGEVWSGTEDAWTLVEPTPTRRAYDDDAQPTDEFDAWLTDFDAAVYDAGQDPYDFDAYDVAETFEAGLAPADAAAAYCED